MNYLKDKAHWQRNYSHQYQIFSLNGTGRSGKTTLAKRLEADDKGIRVLPYYLRDRFERIVYRSLDRTPEQRNVEVFGIATIGWMIAEYHWRIKPYLNEGGIVIFDHYLFDYFVEILPDLEDISTFVDFIQETAMPQINRGNHFYLDIDYPTYQSRADRFLEEGKELNVVPQSIFNERRERYHTLCDAGLLIQVNAMTSIEETYQTLVAYFPKPKEDT